MTAGERLKAFRVSRGLSQTELGGLLRVDQTYVSQLERDKHSEALGLDIAHAIKELTKDWRDERGRKLGPIQMDEWLRARTNEAS